MLKLSTILALQDDDKLRFMCPGCKSFHAIHVNQGKSTRWDWNGDITKPTFTPSINVTWDDGDEKYKCHSYVTNGNIQFLNDCTHDLVGKTVPLPPID
jgi:transposase-like protein